MKLLNKVYFSKKCLQSKKKKRKKKQREEKKSIHYCEMNRIWIFGSTQSLKYSQNPVVRPCCNNTTWTNELISFHSRVHFKNCLYLFVFFPVSEKEKKFISFNVSIDLLSTYAGYWTLSLYVGTPQAPNNGVQTTRLMVSFIYSDSWRMTKWKTVSINISRIRIKYLLQIMFAKWKKKPCILLFVYKRNCHRLKDFHVGTYICFRHLFSWWYLTGACLRHQGSRISSYPLLKIWPSYQCHSR